MPKPVAVAVDLETQSKEDHRAFVKTLFTDLVYDEFQFSELSKDGAIGGFCISKSLPLFLRKKDPTPVAQGGKGWSVPSHSKIPILAAHLNFGVKVGQFANKTREVSIEISTLHVTVRRMKSQMLITEAGPSKTTAAESIHMNRNTAWDSRKENLATLVNQIETQDGIAFTGEEIIDYLVNYEGYNGSYMARMETALPDAIRRNIQLKAGNIKVTIEGDASLTGR